MGFQAFRGSGGQALGAVSNSYMQLTGGASQTVGLWGLLGSLRTCPRRFLGLGARPPRRPIVRPDVPETKLQVRMDDGQRVQVVLNKDAAVSDLFSAVEFEMYEQWKA